MSYHGDINLGNTIRLFFHTFKADGQSIIYTVGTPGVYEDGGTTRITDGVTATINFSGEAGLHLVTVVASGANGFAAGKEYYVTIEDATIDTITTIQVPVGHFSIEHRSALRPTTAGRTLDVAATGEAGLDLDNTVGTIAAAQLATDCITAAKIEANAIGASELATDAIGAAQIAADAIGSSEIAASAANEIRDAILAATITELVSVPGASPSLTQALSLAFMALRNQVDIDKNALTKEIHNDAGVVLGTKVLSDDGALYREAKMS